MNRLIRSTQKRYLIPIVSAAALVLWFSLCRSHYDSYWHGTIYRVQTVDFNILHHTLPPSLSQLILTGRADEIQALLDSTYGIFGLVVTDAQGKDILFRTQATYKHESWQPYLSVDYLNRQSEPFDLLTDPPPAAAQHAHKSPRSAQAEPSIAPGGRVIGRVYYVRGVPPSFGQDLIGALTTSWFEMTGSKRGYIILTLNIIGYAVALVALLMWRKRVLELREKELVSQEAELAIRRKALDHLTQDLSSQRKKKEWLEQEAELAYQRALRLKESLVKIKEAFFFIDPNRPGGNEGKGQINVRPPLHKASELIGDVETLLPELTHNAKVLRSQAEVWQTYCLQLESRQQELQRLLLERNNAARAGGPASQENPSRVSRTESSAKFS